MAVVDPKVAEGVDPVKHGPTAVDGRKLSGGPTVVVLTDAGISMMEQQVWTLEEKAAHFEAMFATGHYTRHNLVASCDLTKYADISTCTNHDDDNDGLWTSLVTAAEAFRFAVTKDPTAQSQAMLFFSGLELLNNVTGKPGLMARSAVAPGEPHQSGAHDKTIWHNSTDPTLIGWEWKGDTSSDEVAGHLFAYPILRKLATEVGSKER
jgi:hypothetical protein